MAEAASSMNLCELVAEGCQILGHNGHDDFTLGHVSARDPDGRGTWMKANDLGLREVTAENVILLSDDGAVLEGDGRRHLEYPIHTEVLSARRDIQSVVHTHSAHAVALGAAGVSLRPVSHAATLFVPPDVPRFTQTSDLIITPELGRAVAACLEDRPAVLLVNHGIVTVGASVQEAVVRAVMLEMACRQQLLTAGFGGCPSWTGEEEALKKQAMWDERMILSFWAYLVRGLPTRSV